ncbi:MAG: gamma-glutamylcyclotransferase [Chromatiales bacterium]|nr:gamma-glutamylcyclotransferase [Chromatiales bacterium]
MSARRAPWRVFVYGTLRSGDYNHALLGTARRLGTCRTAARYTLHDFGAWPGLRVGGRDRITGEVYAVDRATLARLDRLEQVPRRYRRALLSTPWGQAFVYLTRDRRGPRIANGDWMQHRNTNAPNR